jgi:hypothetical protein
VDLTVPTPPERRHSIADTLALVDAIRAIAYEPSHRSPPDDQMRRIRDAFGEYDGMFDDDC